MSLFLRDTAPAPAASTPYATELRTITAAGRRINLTSAADLTALKRSTPDLDWQTRAWNAYDTIGEVHYAANFTANLISKLTFFPAAVPQDNANTTPVYAANVPSLTPGLATAAENALRRLTTTPPPANTTAPAPAPTAPNQGHTNFSDFIRLLALHLFIPGEAYICQIPRSYTTAESWQIRSVDEVLVTDDPAYPILLRDTPATTPATATTATKLPPTAFVARVWRRHPRFAALADSSMKAVIDTVDDFNTLRASFTATARSRLNTGILYVPDGLAASNPGAAAPAPGADTPEEDEFENALLEGMLTPVQDPASPAAVVPILVRGPAELGEKIRTITFDRTFDPSLIHQADRALERILQGLDLPKEVISGIASAKYANAIVIEETTFRAHLEPLAIAICDIITEVYLRPALTAAGFSPHQAAQITLWYDSNTVVRRPNREQSAIAAYDRFALSSRALREATGFAETDAPTPSEVILRMMFQRGPLGPELAEALMRAIAPIMLADATDAAATAESALPPELLEALGAPNPTPTPTPTEPEPAPAPAPAPTPTGPRAARPATPGASTTGRTESTGQGEIPLPDGVTLLPPTPRAPRSTE